MLTYQIRINDELYESSPDRQEALHLYRTVDATCLQAYQGKTKTLVKVTDGKDEVLRSDIIKAHRKGLHF